MTELTSPALTTLAITDAVLCATCLYGACRQTLPYGARLACALLALAAMLGVLHFSGLYPLPSLHSFASMLGGMVSLPLLAIGVAAPHSLVASTKHFAWTLAVVLGVLGLLIITLGGFRIVTDAVAALCVLTMLVAAYRQRSRAGLVAACVLLLTLVAVLLKWQIPSASSVQNVPLLQTTDLLHLGLAAGIFAFVQFYFFKGDEA